MYAVGVVRDTLEKDVFLISSFCMRENVHRHDLASGFFWLGISSFVSFRAVQLGLGSLSEPGPGFLLFWSSLVLGTLSIFLVIKAILGKGGQGKLADSWRGFKWTNVFITILALFLYASFLSRIGFLLMTFGFMVLLFRLGKLRPWMAVVCALITVILVYIIFHFALKTQFPKGILGF